MGRTLKPIEHGTYSGWNAHRNRHIPMCDECRHAQTEYMRRRRQNPRVTEREREAQRLRGRAETRAAQWVREHRPDVWANCQEGVA